jgi:hypothetical protein
VEIYYVDLLRWLASTSHLSGTATKFLENSLCHGPSHIQMNRFFESDNAG